MEVGIEPQTLFWAVVNFIVFFAILRLVFWRPMLNLIEGRRREIVESLGQAEAARAEAERLLREHKAQVGRAEAEAREILAKAGKAAEGARDRIVEEARTEAQRLVERAHESIDREKETAIAEIRQEVASLTIMAAAKVINRTLSPDEHRRLAEEALEEVERR